MWLEAPEMSNRNTSHSHFGLSGRVSGSQHLCQQAQFVSHGNRHWYFHHVIAIRAREHFGDGQACWTMRFGEFRKDRWIQDFCDWINVNHSDPFQQGPRSDL